MSGLAFAAFGVDLLGRQEEYRAGKASASELKAEAVRIGKEARDRELMRRRDLNKILSSQAAQFAGSGLMLGTGSTQAVMQSSAAAAQEDWMADRAMTVERQKRLYAQARAVKKAAKRGGVIGTISDAFGAYVAGGQW